jgi:hypothetical protein
MMHTSTTRIVEPAGTDGRWAVRGAPGGIVLAIERTQRAALDAARAGLAANGGGTVVVYGVDGTVKRRVAVSPGQVPEAPRAAQVDPADPADPADVLDAAGAAAARLQGRAFDRDGDGEADGEGTLDRVFDLGPSGEAKTAITHARRWLAWSATILALFPLIPASVLSQEMLGAGFVGIFLGSLAWSLGVALIAFALIAHPNGWSMVWLSALGVVAFWLSNAIAAEVGGAVLNAASPLPTSFPAGVLPWIGELLVAAGEMYGWLGLLIATALGILVGWRGAELVRASNQ